MFLKYVTIVVTRVVLQCREPECNLRAEIVTMLHPGGNPLKWSVVTENSVRSENTGVPTICEIMVATTMSSLFVALFALVASSFRTRAALQVEILALRLCFAKTPAAFGINNFNYVRFCLLQQGSGISLRHVSILQGRLRNRRSLLLLASKPPARESGISPAAFRAETASSAPKA